VAFTVTIHLAHVIETGERRERFREDRAGEMGSEGDQGRRHLGRVDEHVFMVFSLSVPYAARPS
jgi:hypothetical protein